MRSLMMFPVFVCGFAVSALAQSDTTEILPSQLDSELVLEPTDEVTNPDLHDDGDYSSKAVGKKKNWQLDSGEFDLDSTAPKPQSNSTDDGAYSGIRLRLPTKPK